MNGGVILARWDGEPVERMLRRLQRFMDRENLTQEIRRRGYHLTRRERARAKAHRAAARRARQEEKLARRRR